MKRTPLNMQPIYARLKMHSGKVNFPQGKLVGYLPPTDLHVMMHAIDDMWSLVREVERLRDENDELRKEQAQARPGSAVLLVPVE